MIAAVTSRSEAVSTAGAADCVQWLCRLQHRDVRADRRAVQRSCCQQCQRGSSHQSRAATAGQDTDEKLSGVNEGYPNKHP